MNLINVDVQNPNFDDNVGRALERLSREEDVEYSLEKSDIQRIHEIMIEKFGGEHGVRDIKLFESVCVTPYQSVFGTDLCPTIFDKAAKYLYDFANYQVFVDGNKRTGLAVCTTLLDLNGYTLEMTSDELYRLVMDVANKRIEMEDVTSTIKTRSIFKEDKEYERDY